jgi:1-phosphatidylinositol-4-phosphate 5-kinase
MSSHISTDGYLQPPPLTLGRQAKRRNTIGSSASPIAPLITGYDDINADGELASEIQQQQEQIMRERLSKRAIAQQEAEAALTRAKADPERPLVGNWIKEGHENYVLMYNMLTGIRIAVGDECLSR